MTGGRLPDPNLACIILAHSDPIQVRRLIGALDPFPIFLHVDIRTPDEVHTAMTADLPARCTILNRIRTGWARWENVAAELDGYRAALHSTDATHFALLTGTDYPLASQQEILSTLESYRGKSVALVHEMPRSEWGQNGGFSRLRYRHWVFRKHMLRLPIRRSLPAGIVFAGGSQLKILSREHAKAVVEAADNNPDLVRFWKRSWVADETFVPSILKSPQFVPQWEDEHVNATAWWIGWDGTRRKSPPWLGSEHTAALLSRRTHPGQTIDSLFARKFSTDASTDVLDAIDRSAGRHVPAEVLHPGRRS